MQLTCSQNPLLAASNAANGGASGDDDKLSDYVPGSRDISVSRAVSTTCRDPQTTRCLDEWSRISTPDLCLTPNSLQFLRPMRLGISIPRHSRTLETERTR